MHPDEQSKENKNITDIVLKDINDLKIENDLLKNQQKEDKNKIKNYCEKITSKEMYIEHNFPDNEINHKIFGIIHCTQVDIAKFIFREVEFMTITDWREKIDNVKGIYIQREGVQRRDLNNIKAYCSKNNIKVIECVSIQDEKNLIEIISIIKNKQECEFNGNIAR